MALGKRIVVWFAVLGLLVVPVTALTFVSVTKLLSSSIWLQNSYKIIDTLDRTEADFNGAEAAERGYALSYRDTMLAPFRADLPAIFNHLALLRLLTADNPDQQHLLGRLEQHVGAELKRMRVVVAGVHSAAPKAAVAMVNDPRDIGAIAGIHETIGMMRATEQTLLTQRLRNAEFFGWLTLWACIVSALAGAGILGIVVWLIRSEALRREKSETSLQQSNVRLERSLSELRQYNELAWAIRLMGELLQTCRNTPEVLNVATKHLAQLLPGSAGAIGLFNNEHDQVETLQCFGEAPPFEGQFASDNCWALRRGHMHVSDADGAEPLCPHLSGGSRDTICVPLIAQGKALGVLSVSAGHDGRFSEIEQQILQTISEQLSLSLSNVLLQDSLRERSLRDPLTGLFNRRYLDESLPREVARARRRRASLVVAMIDLDHFKAFNDAHGHAGGDALLARIGELLLEHSRSEDIVCRYGGEEFALILPGISLDVARRRLETMRKALHETAVFLQGERLAAVTASIGLSAFPVHGATGPDLLSAADGALYEAKNAGRDQICVAMPSALPVAQSELPQAG